MGKVEVRCFFSLSLSLSLSHWRYFDKNFTEISLEKSPMLHMNFVRNADGNRNDEKKYMNDEADTLQKCL